MQDLTPASVKSRGLLAILGTSQHLRASRAKLQDKLWSDRGHDQGANSLRQALTEIRRSFGDHRDVVLSGSGWAALDPQKVQVTLTPVTNHANPKIVEFAEDIDIRDPEFEDWLREQRQYFSAQWQSNRALTQPSVSPSHLALIVTGTTPRGSETAAMSDMILRDGAERAAAFMPAHVFDDPGRPGNGVPGIAVDQRIDLPAHFAIGRVQCQEPAVQCAQKHLAILYCDTAVNHVAAQSFGPRSGNLWIVLPPHLASDCIQCHDSGPGAGGVHHALDDDRCRFQAAFGRGRLFPGQT